ncbi:Imm15 family immunity protein [Piscirickettsia litoralis]|uniref:Uncharacterized protein n=1 Tax=Piscirickettsia litoralis TaxID=1891921 RepID=A0ABX2ZXD5_9GAMM|nr:Imm15 family immunity protein [Piscirickettsia litoralis]ODN41277.1 hypothetical protein BGC07_17060 [Piscirickettsia litoralis]
MIPRELKVKFEELIKIEELEPKKFFGLYMKTDVEEVSLYSRYHRADFLRQIPEDEANKLILEFSLQHLKRLMTYANEHFSLEQKSKLLLCLSFPYDDIVEEPLLIPNFSISPNCYHVFRYANYYMEGRNELDKLKRIAKTLETYPDLSIFHSGQAEKGLEYGRVKIGYKTKCFKDLASLDLLVAKLNEDG